MKKLDAETVFEIKAALKKGIRNKQLAKQFNITESTVSRIKNNLYYSRICVPSQEYSDGYEEGYKRGFRDSENLLKNKGVLAEKPS